jgi:Tfp pilus assembly protein PilV
MRITSRLTPRRASGFSLIEACLATVIIGVGVVAMLELIAAGTRVNVDGAELTTGINLARNVREMTLKLPFAQLKALDGTNYATPIDSRGIALTGFDGWAQTISVSSVNPDQLTTTISDPDPDAVRITVTTLRNGSTVANIHWYAFNGTP